MSIETLRHALTHEIAMTCYLEENDDRTVIADINALLEAHQPTETLRDKFAAKAMQAFAAHSVANGYSHDSRDQTPYAQTAYEWADAMLEARK